MEQLFFLLFLNMKIKNFSVLLILIFSFTTINCKKESPNEITNEILKGKWSVPFITIEGIEYQVQSSNFEMTFFTGGGIDGTSIWETPFDPYVEMPYEVKNDGTQIDFDGETFNIRKLTQNELIIHGNWEESFWKITAKRIE